MCLCCFHSNMLGVLAGTFSDVLSATTGRSFLGKCCALGSTFLRGMHLLAPCFQLEMSKIGSYARSGFLNCDKVGTCPVFTNWHIFVSLIPILMPQLSCLAQTVTPCPDCHALPRLSCLAYIDCHALPILSCLPQTVMPCPYCHALPGLPCLAQTAMPCPDSHALPRLPCLAQTVMPCPYCHALPRLSCLAQTAIPCQTVTPGVTITGLD